MQGLEHREAEAQISLQLNCKVKPLHWETTGIQGKESLTFVRPRTLIHQAKVNCKKKELFEIILVE